LSIFVSHDIPETDLPLSEEQESGASFLDLPLGPDTDGGLEIRYFDAHPPDSDVIPIVPKVSAPAGPSPGLHQGLGGWGPRVRRRRAPRAVFESSSSSDTGRASHGKGRWLVALLILATLPLGAALGYFLSLAPPVAVLSPELLDFGTVAVGETVERQAKLENRGEQVLSVVEVALSGGETADFALLAEGCRGAVLENGASCPLRVAFRPTAKGGRRAELLLRSNAVDGLRVLLLLGEGQ